MKGCPDHDCSDMKGCPDHDCSDMKGCPDHDCSDSLIYIYQHAISVYHLSFFKSHSWPGVLHTTLCDQAC
jgi:hypothetical protein